MNYNITLVLLLFSIMLSTVTTLANSVYSEDSVEDTIHLVYSSEINRRLENDTSSYKQIEFGSQEGQ